MKPTIHTILTAIAFTASIGLAIYSLVIIGCVIKQIITYVSNT